MGWSKEEAEHELVYDLRQTYAEIITEILRRISVARTHKDFVSWFEALDDLHTEINQKLSPKEREGYKKKLKHTINILNTHAAVYTGMDKNINTRYLIHTTLKDLEMWLKEMMEKHKMFGAREDIEMLG